MKHNPTVNENTTDEEIREIGIQALQRELGVANAVRFLLLFDKGRGDYTEERHQWLDQLSMEDVLAQLQAMRSEATK